MEASPFTGALTVPHDGVLLRVPCGELKQRSAFKVGVGAPRHLQFAIKLGEDFSSQAAVLKIVPHSKWPKLREWLLEHPDCNEPAIGSKRKAPQRCEQSSAIDDDSDVLDEGVAGRKPRVGKGCIDRFIESKYLNETSYWMQKLGSRHCRTCESYNERGEYEERDKLRTVNAELN
ncbi:hypothetical protein AB1Y20_006262 [Prymnesium parvum]|uniref:Uncharacterized protein n=1 Tax=Prymnesium parvum TaxID=97485 RepID=A0AB34J282_PRYPA